MMNANFVLVDFENVQPKNIGALKGGAFQIKVFVGASQSKVSLEMAQALQSFGSDAEYIQISANGSNALDFHIAYYIGRLSREHPGASFTIISKDTGFDPLIRHLKAHEIECRRSTTIADVVHGKLAAVAPRSPATPAAKKIPKPATSAAPKAASKATAKAAQKSSAATAASAPPAIGATTDLYNAVLSNFGKRQDGLPRTLKTISSTIKAMFKPLGDAELAAVLDRLIKAGKIQVDDGRVTYAL